MYIAAPLAIKRIRIAKSEMTPGVPAAIILGVELCALHRHLEICVWGVDTSLSLVKYMINSIQSSEFSPAQESGSD